MMTLPPNPTYIPYSKPYIPMSQPTATYTPQYSPNALPTTQPQESKASGAKIAGAAFGGAFTFWLLSVIFKR
jgi:hypothetical protein